jgi:RHH-type rel operon transcriptional repressor/antitoxin RelB
MFAIQLPKSIEKRFTKLARRTGRTKTSHICEAILNHLEGLEDVYIAERRLKQILSENPAGAAQVFQSCQRRKLQASRHPDPETSGRVGRSLSVRHSTESIVSPTFSKHKNSHFRFFRHPKHAI